MNGPSTTKTPTHRRLLVAAVCSLCKDCGFESVTKSAIESLAELLQFCECDVLDNIHNTFLFSRFIPGGPNRQGVYVHGIN